MGKFLSIYITVTVCTQNCTDHTMFIINPIVAEYMLVLDMPKTLLCRTKETFLQDLQS